MAEPEVNREDPVLDYIQSISAPLFGIPSERLPSLLNSEDTKYALTRFGMDSNVMALYVEWFRESDGGE